MLCFAFCSAVFEEPEDPSNRSFFSEIISSISDVKFSHSGRCIMTRDYLTVKVWDLNMENRPVETYQVQTPARAHAHRALEGSESASACRGLQCRVKDTVSHFDIQKQLVGRSVY